MRVSKEEKSAQFTNFARYKCLEYLKRNGVDLYLCYCGIEECDPAHHYGPIERSEFLLHYILDGKGTYTVDGKTWHLGKHQLFLICPDTTTYYEADKDEPWTYLWIGFNGLKAKSYLSYANLDENSLIGEYHESQTLVTYLQSMLDSSKLTYENELKREGYLFLFLSALVGSHGKSASSSYDYSYRIYVEHAIEFIEHNLAKNIKVSDLADYIGINRSYLTFCFQKAVSMSPQQYLIQYRIDTAKRLLKSTTLSIGAIAAQVGYEDALAFSKIFRQVCGTNPKAYRLDSEETVDSQSIPEH